MNRILLAVLTALVVAVSGQAQIIGQNSPTDRQPAVNAISLQEAEAGQLAPLIYTGTITCAGNVQDTTRWLHIGWTPSHTTQGAVNSNAAILRFNPDKFTLSVVISSDGDSIDLAEAWFTYTYDTTALEGWNGDSSNVFVNDGNSNRADYGIWTFENLVGLETTFDDFAFVYPLRVLRGAFIRIYFRNDVSGNNVSYAWTLTVER